MTHPRKAIRSAFKARIINAPGIGDMVHDQIMPVTTIVDMLEEADGLPVVLIYAQNEPKVEYPKARFNGVTVRTLEVGIEAILLGSDDDADAIAEIIEGLLEDWVIPGYEGAEISLMETQIATSTDFKRPITDLLMFYEVKYQKAYRVDQTPDYLADDAWVNGGDDIPASLAEAGNGP